MSESQGPGGSSRPASEWVTGGSFVVAALSAAWLATAYVRGWSTQVLGAALAVTLASIGYGLGMLARHYLPTEAVEGEREELASSVDERAEFIADFRRGDESIAERRWIVKAMGLAVVALGGALLFPLRSLTRPREDKLRTTAWAPGRRLVDKDGRPVRIGELPVGAIVTVFPEGNHSPGDSQTVLIRLEQGALEGDERSDWSPRGHIAFSKVCTHAGCPVGLYRAQTHELLCPCHQSVFDVLDAAKPVFGPATRPLPQLPLFVDDEGFLRAQSDFLEPVGPGWWTLG